MLLFVWATVIAAAAGVLGMMLLVAVELVTARRTRHERWQDTGTESLESEEARPDDGHEDRQPDEITDEDFLADVEEVEGPDDVEGPDAPADPGVHDHTEDSGSADEAGDVHVGFLGDFRRR